MLDGDPDLRRAAAGFSYAHPFVRRIIRDHKYLGIALAGGAVRALAARWAVKHAPALYGACETVVPLPLHPARERERGFNQADAVAKALADAIGAGVRRDTVIRERNTRPQAKLEEGRDENVEGAFSVPRPERCAGKTFLLVDDVWTTGSTMRSCARALLDAGARSVSGFALAAGSLPRDGETDACQEDRDA
jgi:ComF family protein